MSDKLGVQCLRARPRRVIGNADCRRYAQGDDDGGSNYGAVYILTDTDNDGSFKDTTGTPAGVDLRRRSPTTLGTYSNASSAYLGTGVSFDGNRLAIGAYYADGTKGTVYILTDTDNDGDFTDTTGSPAGVSAQKLSGTIGPYALSSQDRFGGSVALDGNILVVGASNAQSQKGAAYILTDTDNDGDFTDYSTGGTTVSKIHNAIAGDTFSSGDYFGDAVAVRNDVVAISASRLHVGGVADVGEVYLLRDHDGDGDYADSGTLVERMSDYLQSGLIGLNDRFGIGLLFHDDGIFAGQNDAGGNGVVYQFEPAFAVTLGTDDFEKDGTPTSGDDELAAGTISLSATPTDKAGNAGSAATGSFTYDPTVPTVSSVGANGTKLLVTMSENVWAATAPTAADFSIAGGTMTISSISGIASTAATATNWFTITLSAATAGTETLSYTQNSGRLLKDTGGNTLASFTGTAVNTPSLVLTTPISTDGYVTDAEDENTLTISGTSAALSTGTTVTVTFDGAGTDITSGVTGTVGSDGTWSASITSTQLKALDAATPAAAGETIAVTATATDSNTATP